MEILVNRIIDLPIIDKVNGSEINKRLLEYEFPEHFNALKKVCVTMVAREPNDMDFDCWIRAGKIYLTIPLVYNEVVHSTAEKITQKSMELIDTYIQHLDFNSIDRLPDRAEFIATKIIDAPIEDKINLKRVNTFLESIELNEVLDEFRKVIITFVAREQNDFLFDYWRRDEKLYVIIPLDYEEVVNSSIIEVSAYCIHYFDKYKNDIQFPD